jgi:hypothetical protein
VAVACSRKGEEDEDEDQHNQTELKSYIRPKKGVFLEKGKTR